MNAVLGILTVCLLYLSFLVDTDSLNPCKKENIQIQNRYFKESSVVSK